MVLAAAAAVLLLGACEGRLANDPADTSGSSEMGSSGSSGMYSAPSQVPSTPPSNIPSEPAQPTPGAAPGSAVPGTTNSDAGVPDSSRPGGSMSN